MTLEPPLPSPLYKDKKTGLIVFGVFQILLGALFALMLLAMLAGQYAMAHNPEMAARTDPRSLLPTAVLMGGFVVGFVWLGIGAIRARRWARAINLCLGAMGLVFGLFACAMLVWMLPNMEAMMHQTAQQTGQKLPAAAILVAKIVTVVMSLLFYMIIPGALFLFYRSENVRLTCEARDPVVRWTDRCPPPVLALVLFQVVGFVSMLLFLPIYGRAFPFFGLLLQGPAAMAVYSGFGLFTFYVAWGFYRLQRRALWAYAGVLVVFTLSGLISFSGDKLMLYYKALGLPEAQLRLMDQMPLVHSAGVLWLGGAGVLLLLGYLYWIKKYFSEARAAGGSPQ